MYNILLPVHSYLRWLVLLTLIGTLLAALHGWLTNRPYSKVDGALRSAATSIAHLQLLIGFVLYFKSPITSYFRANFSAVAGSLEFSFFGLIHISLMLLAVVVLTLGSSFGRRAETALAKHRTVALYFLAALIVILIAIPWPFSPLAQRPYFRTF
ncbi:hypothetical protein BN8_04351 [Fibrisoma limi BUZ 3]|uniref:Cytochrome B n=1 Tax=Fibrisoma limi BUZ 3 TaxID=1185876 RepID=I2GMI8_9BACT|nr:hypothetical protein [Fibrisoma limi]CCH55116.1 hypothetical protein BN8_04351 [Fibrisoma limi BUZ 3]